MLPQWRWHREKKWVGKEDSACGAGEPEWVDVHTVWAPLHLGPPFSELAQHFVYGLIPVCWIRTITSFPL